MIDKERLNTMMRWRCVLNGFEASLIDWIQQMIYYSGSVERLGKIMNG